MRMCYLVKEESEIREIKEAIKDLPKAFLERVEQASILDHRQVQLWMKDNTQTQTVYFEINKAFGVLMESSVYPTKDEGCSTFLLFKMDNGLELFIRFENIKKPIIFKY